MLPKCCGNCASLVKDDGDKHYYCLKRKKPIFQPTVDVCEKDFKYKRRMAKVG